MTSARSIISFGSMGSPHTIPKVDEVKDLLLRLDELLFEAVDLHFLLLVLHQPQLLVIVQQVIDLPTIDFIHRNCHSEVPLLLLKVGDASVEEVFDSQLLEPIHSKSLP